MLRDGLGMSGKDLKTTTIDPNRDFSDTEGRKEVETFPFGPIVLMIRSDLPYDISPTDLYSVGLLGV